MLGATVHQCAHAVRRRGRKCGAWCSDAGEQFGHHSRIAVIRLSQHIYLDGLLDSCGSVAWNGIHRDFILPVQELEA